MLYQKLLMGNKPYFVSVGNAGVFETHRHPEIEISYCLEGCYDIICENKRIHLTSGDFVVISPMAEHEVPKGNDATCKSLTIEVGYTLLGEFFETFTYRKVNGCLYKKRDLQHTALYRNLAALLEETAALHCSNAVFGDLSIKGNLYKISSLLLQMIYDTQSIDSKSRKLNDVKKIDNALATIYNNYYQPLDIETVSSSCGYSKSNFCKIFKNITGDTFHNTLNSHRIEVACMLLRETNYTIEKIARETGFTDTKSFCRVFKKLKNKNAGEYRKNLKAE